MTKKDYLDQLTEYAEQYSKDAPESLERNNHMNDIDDGEKVQQRIVDYCREQKLDIENEKR